MSSCCKPWPARPDIDQLTSGYGLIVVDECHHIPPRVRARRQADPGPPLARTHRHPVRARQARRLDSPPVGPDPAHHRPLHPPQRGQHTPTRIRHDRAPSDARAPHARHAYAMPVTPTRRNPAVCGHLPRSRCRRRPPHPGRRRRDHRAETAVGTACCSPSGPPTSNGFADEFQRRSLDPIVLRGGMNATARATPSPASNLRTEYRCWFRGSRWTSAVNLAG